MMSPPANSVHVAAGSNAVPDGAAGRLRDERPVGQVAKPVDAEQLAVAPAERPDVRRDRVGTKECEPVAMRGEVGAERRAIRREDEPPVIRGAIDAERGQDGIGLAVDQLQRGVAPARSVEDVVDFALRRRRRGRAEAA